MDTHELRLGNHIMFSEDGTVFEVTSIDINGMGVRNEDEEIWIEHDVFEPIPLTEQWLLELGFRRHHADYSNDVLYIKNVPNNNEFEWGVYPNELGSGIQIQYRRKLKYIHELENIYFSITNINLSYIKQNEKNNN